MKTAAGLDAALRAVLEVLRRIRQRTSPARLEYAPAGWQTVLPGENATGWESVRVAAHEREQWQDFLRVLQGSGPLGFNHEHGDLSLTEHLPFHNINVSFGYVLALAAHLKTTIKVLDYGGGLGHYYKLGQALLPGLALDYHCKEVLSMAETGQALNPEIVWHIDDDCLASSFDLVIIGGSLQYIEHWQSLLQKISQAVGEYLYLTGIPVVSSGAPFVAVQHAYGTHMLHWQFCREELLKVLTESGLELMREFVLEDCPYIKNAPSQCKMRGWLFRKKQ